MSGAEQAITANGLRKAYGGRPALRELSFGAARGEVLALLGPNGAGKTTALRILSTELRPDAGTALIGGLTLGAQNRAIRGRIGTVFQTGALDGALTVEENLSVRGALYGLRGERLRERLLTVSRLTQLEPLLGSFYGRLSGGQRRRCDIARALLPDPAVLFLDEPATGLDPEMQLAVREAVERLRADRRVTVLMSTHNLDDAEQADRVLILRGGALLASGTPSELRQRFAQDSLVLYSRSFERLKQKLDACGAAYRLTGDGARVSLHGTLGALPLLTRCRGAYDAFEVRRGTLEQAYLTALEGDGRYADTGASQHGPVFTR